MDVVDQIDPARLPRVAGPAAFVPAGRVAGDPHVVVDGALIESGEAVIEDHPGADVAVVRTPRPPHHMAVHPRTPRTRILTATPDGTLVLRHRYETWVAYVSRALAPRVDLAPLLPRLQALERNPGAWRFDGVEPIRPRLSLGDAQGRPVPSSREPERLTTEPAGFLKERAA